ncbi:hypothetical protein F5Y06DRAFT_306384 [Hypoxylon sp. FL0890]|nr:hypothetical protein F5Y06DRAFT_306384 [Hypoxylon sp. FL0890]
MEPKPPQRLSPEKEKAIEVTWYSSLSIFIVGVYNFVFNKILSVFNFWKPLHHTTFANWLCTLFNQYKDDNKRLEGICQEICEHTTVFISICVHTWDGDQTKLTDIGMSFWIPRTVESNTYSRHWRIRENASLKSQSTPNEPDTFTFGNTDLICETEIAPLLDEFLMSMITRFEKVVIVGHGIRSTMYSLRKHWKPPGSVAVLDTQKIWQVQHQRLEKVSLEEALNTTLGVSFDTYLLHNAGNDSCFILQLLQTQGRFGHRLSGTDSEKHAQPLENSKF